MEIDIEFIWKLNDMHQSSGLTKFNKKRNPQSKSTTYLTEQVGCFYDHFCQPKHI